jgi:hypothetical protein
MEELTPEEMEVQNRLDSLMSKAELARAVATNEVHKSAPDTENREDKDQKQNTTEEQTESAKGKQGFPNGRHISFNTEEGGYKHWVVVASLPSTELETLLNISFRLGYTVEQLNVRKSHAYDLILRRVGG